MGKAKEEEFKVTLQREKSLSYLDGCITGLKFANSCDDAISRKEVLETFGGVLGIWGRKALMEMKPVLPTYQQGKWIKEYDNSALDGLYHCSVCGRKLWIHKEESVSDYPYCHCGARNTVEVEDGN